LREAIDNFMKVFFRLLSREYENTLKMFEKKFKEKDVLDRFAFETETITKGGFYKIRIFFYGIPDDDVKNFFLVLGLAFNQYFDLLRALEGLGIHFNVSADDEINKEGYLKFYNIEVTNVKRELLT